MGFLTRVGLAATIACSFLASPAAAGPAGGRTGDQQRETIPELALVCENAPSTLCPADPQDAGYCIPGSQTGRIFHDVCNPNQGVSSACQGAPYANACVPRSVGVLPGELLISSREQAAVLNCNGIPGNDYCIRLLVDVGIDVDGNPLLTRSFTSAYFEWSAFCRGDESADGLRFSDWFPFRNRECVFGLEPGIDEIDFEGMLLPGNPAHQPGSPYTFAAFEAALAAEAEWRFGAPAGSVLPTALLDGNTAPLFGLPAGRAARLDIDDVTWDVTNNLTGERERIYDFLIPIAITRPIPPLLYTEQKILAPGALNGDKVGSSIVMDGNVLVAGAPLANGGRGAAHVFRFTDAAWVHEATLQAPDGAVGDLFGSSVGVSGDVILVGARFDDEPDRVDQGSAYFFRRANGLWQAPQKVQSTTPQANDQFGAVAVDGSLAVIGAPTNGSRPGSAHVYRYDGTSWTFDRKLTSPFPQTDDQFGSAVAIEGERVVVSAYEEDVDGIVDAGAVYVYQRSGGLWPAPAKLLSGDTSADDDFGFDIGLSGDRIIAGTLGAGAAYIFQKESAGWAQKWLFEVPPVPGSTFFGVSTDIHGDTAVIGSYFEGDADNPYQGAVYLARRQSVGWSIERRLTAQAGVLNDVLGSSVAVTARFFAGGAPTIYSPGQAVSPGAVHLWELPTAVLSVEGSSSGGEGVHLNIRGLVYSFHVGYPGGSPEATAAQLESALASSPLVFQRGVSAVTRVGNRIVLMGVDVSEVTITDENPGDAFSVLRVGECNDLVDNDGDALVDFPADPGCAGSEDLSEHSPLLLCDDGTDNDGDGLVDLADPVCSSASGSREDSECQDDLDNDADGGFDFDGGLSRCGACAHALSVTGSALDPACCGCVERIASVDGYCSQQSWDDICVGRVAAECPPDLGCVDATVSAESAACADGLDNDGDGKIDFGLVSPPADGGCASAQDPDERGPCSDGIDNDGDGLVDYPADPSCVTALDNSVEAQQCENGIDDDADGLIDYPADPDCASPSGVQERKGCGLGGELVLVLPALQGLRSLRRRGAAGRHGVARG